MSSRPLCSLFTAVVMGLLLGGAALAAPPDAGESPPPREVKPADKGAKPAPAPAERRAEPKRRAAIAPTPPPPPPTLPDGTFVGTLRQGDTRWALRMTVVAGMVVHAEAARGAGAQPIHLDAAGAPDSVRVRLTGRDGDDYLQVRGAFFDVERGAGEFDGAFGRRRVQGTWVVARR